MGSSIMVEGGNEEGGGRRPEGPSGDLVAGRRIREEPERGRIWVVDGSG